MNADAVYRPQNVGKAGNIAEMHKSCCEAVSRQALTIVSAAMLGATAPKYYYFTILKAGRRQKLMNEPLQATASLHFITRTTLQ